MTLASIWILEIGVEVDYLPVGPKLSIAGGSAFSPAAALRGAHSD